MTNDYDTFLSVHIEHYLQTQGSVTKVILIEDVRKASGSRFNAAKNVVEDYCSRKEVTLDVSKTPWTTLAWLALLLLLFITICAFIVKLISA